MKLRVKKNDTDEEVLELWLVQEEKDVCLYSRKSAGGTKKEFTIEEDGSWCKHPYGNLDEEGW